MDLKIIRQPLTVNDAVFSSSGEIPIDEDFQLPDYFAEINKMLKCKCEGRITSKAVSGMSMVIDGHVCINLLYCDKDGELFSYEHIFPFSKTFDVSQDLTGAIIEATLKNEYLNCRVVTERKVSVHGALTAQVKAVLMKKYEVIADIDEDKIQINRKEIPALNSVGNAEKNMLLEEELTLSSGQPSIVNVLRYSAFPTVTEVKALKNKASVKGNLAVTVLYRSEKQCAVYKSVVPFSQILEINGLFDECVTSAKVQLCYLEVKPIVSNNEQRAMQLSAKLNVSVKSFCDEKIPIISDLYSTEYEVAVTKNDMNIERVLGHIGDNYMFKSTLDFGEAQINNIIDSWCDTEIVSCAFNDGSLTIKAIVNICILAMDSDGKVSFFEKKQEFTYKKPLDYSLDGSLKCDAVFEPISVSFTLLSENSIEYRIEYRVNASMCEEKIYPMICEIGYDQKNKIAKRQDCSMMIYFAKEGEKIWDIAKMYSSDLNEVRQINGITGEALDTDKQILIPII